MVLSTRRGSRRASRPRPWRTPRAWPPVPRPSLPRAPRPRPRRSLAASTAAPPARRCAPYRRRKRPPPRHRARPRPRPWFLGAAGGREAQAYLATAAPALRALCNARRGPRAQRRSVGLVRGGGVGSFCPRFCRRRGPAPRSAVFTAAALPPRRALQRPPSRERARPTRRRGRTWCRPGAGAAAVVSTSRARCGQRCGREPEASLLAPPRRGPGLGRRRGLVEPPGPRGRSPSHSSPPALRRRASSSRAA